MPIERPQDYFAEMVKSDSHMEFIRSKLAKQKDRLERIETKKKVGDVFFSWVVFVFIYSIFARMRS